MSQSGPRGTTYWSPRPSPRRPCSPSRFTSDERPTPYHLPPRSKEALHVADTDRSHEPQASPPACPRVSRSRSHASRIHPHNRPRSRRLLRLCNLGQPRFGGAAGRRLRRRHAGDKREDTEPGVLPRLLRRRPVSVRGARCPLPAASLGRLLASYASVLTLHRRRLPANGLRERTAERAARSRRRLPAARGSRYAMRGVEVLGGLIRRRGTRGETA